MIVHAAIIGIILYFIMRYALKQESYVAEDRSVLIFAVVVMYMVLFGHIFKMPLEHFESIRVFGLFREPKNCHGMPTSINRNIM